MKIKIQISDTVTLPYNFLNILLEAITETDWREYL